jgi:hypothetical protein
VAERRAPSTRARRPGQTRPPRGAPIGVPVEFEPGQDQGGPSDGSSFFDPSRAESGHEPEPGAPPSSAPATAPLCSFGLCPICMALTALGDARPELMEHVLLASREMLLALRALIDARLEGSAGPSNTRLEHLTIG